MWLIYQENQRASASSVWKNCSYYIPSDVPTLGMKSTTGRWVLQSKIGLVISLFPIGNRKYSTKIWIACLVIGRRETVGRTSRSDDFTTGIRWMIGAKWAMAKLHIDQQFGRAAAQKGEDPLEIVLGCTRFIEAYPSEIQSDDRESAVFHAPCWWLKIASSSLHSGNLQSTTRPLRNHWSCR